MAGHAIPGTRIPQFAFVVVSGWFGEWSWLVSAARAFGDWARTGDITAFPRLAVVPPMNAFDPNFWYGLTWRIEVYRGGIDLQQFLSGFGLLLLAGLSWTFYELFLKPFKLRNHNQQ